MIREDLEKREAEILSSAATLSKNSQGRLVPIEPCPYRTAFQRDKDRIIHTKAFRRLKYKTQVFLTSHGDHYRTRLTHTLEVSQIARAIARGLNLNEDLTEAIALGHDLGHTPFGHGGERSLRNILKPYGYDFHHNEQSLRQVDLLENNGKGLNLTFEVRNGILHHTGDIKPETPEGKILCFADRIAYVNHDIDDALRSKILKLTDLPKKPLEVLGHTHGERINTLVASLINNNRDKEDITMEPHIWEAMDELRTFLFQNVYMRSDVQSEEKKADNIIAFLFNYYLDNLQLLPEYLNKNVPVLAVKDYIAGMTDQFAIQQFMRLTIPAGIQTIYIPTTADI